MILPMEVNRQAPMSLPNLHDSTTTISVCCVCKKIIVIGKYNIKDFKIEAYNKEFSAFLERRAPGQVSTDSGGNSVQYLSQSASFFPTDVSFQMTHQMLPERGSPAPGLGAMPTMVSLSHNAASAISPNTSKDSTGQILTRARLQDLVREIDPSEQLDEEVEELLLQLTDDFVESTVKAACSLAKHRKANTVHIKDVQLHLERNWNMWIPGFGTDELRPYKRASVTEAHKQRIALIRKTLKKY